MSNTITILAIEYPRNYDSSIGSLYQKQIFLGLLHNCSDIIDLFQFDEELSTEELPSLMKVIKTYKPLKRADKTYILDVLEKANQWLINNPNHFLLFNHSY